jgi:2',3'-cyclic-nucleotide 2'-phosphodiesterase
MRIAFFGDVVGRPGRRALAIVARRLRRDESLCFVVANGENAAGGKGIDVASAEEIQDAGVDVITTGNHVWQHREIIPYLDENRRVLRPLNFAPGTPGAGWVSRPARNGMAVAVVNLIGRVFMGPADCPFRAIEAELPEIHQAARVVIVDMHAEATSEKVGMARFLDGRVSAVVGSHTHVQTSDEDVLPGGTAALTDAGMCGPEESILGVRTDRVLERFLKQTPVRFEVASGPTLVQGAIIDLDEKTGKATGIRRIRERVAAA